VGRELLVEIIAGKHGELEANTIPNALRELYALGIKPDWWKLEPQSSPAVWKDIEATIQKNDPLCRGVVLLGLEAPVRELRKAFDATAATPIVKGFAVGRSIFSDAAQSWLAGDMSDEQAIDDMAKRFSELCDAWLATRGRRFA
jgi:5-dehydro-2-deoxygluconokinase